MTDGTFWNLFAETGDIEYYLLFKEESKARESAPAGGKRAVTAYRNSSDVKTAG